MSGRRRLGGGQKQSIQSVNGHCWERWPNLAILWLLLVLGRNGYGWEREGGEEWGHNNVGLLMI
jgi:hypothetical protein